MLNAIAKENPSRKVNAYLALQNKSSHPFQQHIKGVVGQHENFSLQVSYAQPNSDDTLGEVYDVVVFSIGNFETVLVVELWVFFCV